jgi:hypothetical protein
VILRHMRRAACSSLFVVIAACHGGSATTPGNRSGGEAPPADVLSRHAGAMRPVIMEDGKPYLWLRLMEPFSDEADQAAAMPTCAEQDRDCWHAMPAPDDKATAFAPLPATVTVLTAQGACTAQVGSVMIVNTSGCDLSITYAAPLTGCGDALGPVAFAAADVATDLRWLPTPPVKMAALPSDAASIKDPVQRRYVERWLASSLAGKRRDGATGLVAVDAGGEALATVVAGAVVGDNPDECELSAVTEEALGLRRGDEFTELHLSDAPEVDGYVRHVTEWDGAIAWRGRIVGVVSGGPRDLVIHAIGPGAAPTPIYNQSIWWDNEECTQGTWSGVEYPCGL